MSKGDLLVERGAKGLEQLSRKAAAKGGFVGSLADELAGDAAFLRKLKPSLIVARAKGKAPVASVPDWEPQAPSAPQASKPRPKPKAKRKRKKGGPSPFLVLGAALAAGVVIAKVIDWRGHAHPRD
jgi:hypothetical protein